MDIDNIQFSPCKYRIADFRLEIPGRSEEYVVSSEFISDILIEMDFENYYFPFFTTTLSLPNNVIRQMRTNQVEIKALVRLQYGYAPINEANYNTSKDIHFFDYINSKFYVYIQNDTPDLEEEYTEEYEKIAGIYKEDHLSISDFSTIQVSLYNEQYLFKSKVIVNEILTSCTLTDAIARILNKAKINNVLMSPVTNGKTYNEFILPPIRTLQQLLRISSEYKLHNKGTNIFFGLDTLYILERGSGCTAWKPNENKTTYIASLLSHDHKNKYRYGCYINNNEKYSMCNMSPDAFVITNETLVTDQVLGNSFTVIDQDTGNISFVDTNLKGPSGTAKNTNVLYYCDGENTSDAIKSHINQSNKTIEVVLYGVNIDMLTPNKEFIFTFDSNRFKNITGSYRITKELIILQKNGRIYDITANCFFKG